MSVAPDTACLDLENPETRVVLMALDVELGLLHRLCTEQGMFFKAVFPLPTSDARRMRLHNYTKKTAPNQSHFDRSYWSPTITVAQIQEIAREAEGFNKAWKDFNAAARKNMFTPAAPAHTWTSLSLLDAELDDLTRGIIDICAQLQRLPSVYPAEQTRLTPTSTRASLHALLARMKAAV
jgi:hypothetical protein